MIKLYAGEAWPRGQAHSVKNLACAHALNWDWPGKLEAAAQAGVEVWPMLQRTSGSLDRYLAWVSRHRVDHMMIENEPLTQKGMSARAFATWVLKEASPVVAETCRDARQIFGGFLITHPGGYEDIRAQVREFAQAIRLGGVDTLAFHPYLPQAPQMDEVPGYAAWFARQIMAISGDWEHFAITEWGVPNGRVSYSGRDVPALAEYMRRGWDTMQAYGCYASAWYMAGPNAQFSEWCDSVLCMENGQPKPLGLVYRELGALEPEEPSSPEEPEAPEWETHNVATWIWGGRQYEATVRSRPL